jgi:hypothetical protein
LAGRWAAGGGPEIGLPPASPAPCGVTTLILVDRLENGERVPPHVGSALNRANVQLEPTTSPARQTAPFMNVAHA